jgi:hypothetical protein
MLKTTTIGKNKRARWSDPIEVRRLHSSLSSCKPSAEFAQMKHIIPVISVNRIDTVFNMCCCLLTLFTFCKARLFLERILFIPFALRNALFIFIFQTPKCHNVSPRQQPHRAISANENTSRLRNARYIDVTSAIDAAKYLNGRESYKNLRCSFSGTNETRAVDSQSSKV